MTYGSAVVEAVPSGADADPDDIGGSHAEGIERAVYHLVKGRYRMPSPAASMSSARTPV